MSGSLVAGLSGPGTSGGEPAMSAGDTGALSSELDVRAVGDDAEKWLGIAQAFAGPPGPGRD